MRISSRGTAKPSVRIAARLPQRDLVHALGTALAVDFEAARLPQPEPAARLAVLQFQLQHDRISPVLHDSSSRAKEKALRAARWRCCAGLVSVTMTCLKP